MAFFTSGTNAAGTLRDLIPVLSKLGMRFTSFAAFTNDMLCASIDRGPEMASAAEQLVRRSLAKVGLKLVKSRRRAELSVDDRGKYSVVRRSTGRFVCSGNYSLTLEEARAVIVLARRGEFDPHPLDGPEFAFDDSALDLLMFDKNGRPKTKFTV